MDSKPEWAPFFCNALIWRKISAHSEICWICYCSLSYLFPSSSTSDFFVILISKVDLTQTCVLLPKTSFLDSSPSVKQCLAASIAVAPHHLLSLLPLLPIEAPDSLSPQVQGRGSIVSLEVNCPSLDASDYYCCCFFFYYYCAFVNSFCFIFLLRKLVGILRNLLVFIR